MGRFKWGIYANRQATFMRADFSLSSDAHFANYFSLASILG